FTKRAPTAPTSRARSSTAPSSLLLKFRDDCRRDAAADVERALDARAPRADRADQIVEDPVGDRFVEGALVAVGPEIQLPGIALDARRVRNVLDPDRGEVRLTGLWAEA